MPEPLALGFDTAGAHCAAAVLQGSAVLAMRDEAMAKGQSERLMPMLDEVLAEAGVGWRDLAVIGVGIGPGSFTGTRIAVAAARGLALGLGIPAVGVEGETDPAIIATAAIARRDAPGPRPAPVYARAPDAAPAAPVPPLLP